MGEDGKRRHLVRFFELSAAAFDAERKRVLMTST